MSPRDRVIPEKDRSGSPFAGKQFFFFPTVMRQETRLKRRGRKTLSTHAGTIAKELALLPLRLLLLLFIGYPRKSNRATVRK